jgi:hypothetical protein
MRTTRRYLVAEVHGDAQTSRVGRGCSRRATVGRTRPAIPKGPLVPERRSELEQEGLGGPQLRRLLFELLSAVEMAVVALGWAVDMVLRADQLIGSPVPVPAPVKASEPALQAKSPARPKPPALIRSPREFKPRGARLASAPRRAVRPPGLSTPRGSLRTSTLHSPTAPIRLGRLPPSTSKRQPTCWGSLPVPGPPSASSQFR